MDSQLEDSATGQLEFEERAWLKVNENLRQHGLPTLAVTALRNTDEETDMVCFDVETSGRARHCLQTLMRDCDRRQGLIQELIVTNNDIREELKTQNALCGKLGTQANDLKAMLDNSKSKIQELEDDLLNTTSTQQTEEATRNTLAALRSKLLQTENKCLTYQNEVQRLSDKLQTVNKHQEDTKTKQSEILSLMKKRCSKEEIQDKMLDVVDMYERQTYELKRELEITKAKLGEDGDLTNDTLPEYEPVIPSYKALVQSYEKQLRDHKKKLKTLENQSEVMKLELEGRPELKDLREAQTRIKKLERLIKKHDLHLHEDKENGEAKKSYRTRVEDLDCLPAIHCHRYLKAICEQVNVPDLEHVAPQVKKLQEKADVGPRLEEFARQVLKIVDANGLPRLPKYRNRQGQSSNHATWCEKTWHHVIPTLEYWSLQLKALKELEQSINKLQSTMFPWQQSVVREEPTIGNLIKTVDSLLYDPDLEQAKDKPHGTMKEQPSRTMLQAIVEHIMELFDIRYVSGVYARMNDLYVKQGEVHNVMKTLRNLLGLEDAAGSSTVVSSVAYLCENANSSTYQQIQALLQTEDLESVVIKVKQHDDFFAVFQELIQKIMETLDVRQMDQVLPAVRALKMLVNT